MYPDAVSIGAHLDAHGAAQATLEALQGGACAVLGAAAVAGSVSVRVDALERDAHGRFHLVDFASAAEVKEQYLDEAAVRCACLGAAGLPVKSVSVCHPDTALAFDPALGESCVLVREDVTDIVASRVPRTHDWVASCASTLRGPEPACRPGPHCTAPCACPFHTHCAKDDDVQDDDRVEYLPAKGGAVSEFIAQGAMRVSDLPAAACSHHRNALVREAIVRGVPVVRETFARQIAALPYPRHFLDFEAAMFAIPSQPGMRPYQPLVFQWSCHSVAAAHAAAEHGEFLDTSGDDPRRPFALALLQRLGEVGPVLTYSGYERQRLLELAQEFPDLHDALLALVARIVDLLPLARRGYYAGAMRGSWSIKAIVRTLPGAREAGVSHDLLTDVTDGMAAQAAYMALVDERNVGLNRDALRASLLAYCAMDTGGLLHFARFVEAHAGH